MLRTLEQRLRPRFRRSGRRKRKSFDFYADGLGVRCRSLDQFSDPAFVAAWGFAAQGNIEAWKGRVPDIRWRAHTCVWAAQQALLLDGDFVECGVNAGLLSMTVCRYLDFANTNRTFWLYDTFNGIPADRLDGIERQAAERHNALYADCYEIARRNFAPFPNANLVRGFLPWSIDPLPDCIAYLSIDLNSATFERQTIEVLWPRLVRGAIVVIDDYGFAGYEEQRRMWDGFAASKGRSVLSMPTGQGLLIR